MRCTRNYSEGFLPGRFELTFTPTPKSRLFAIASLPLAVHISCMLDVSTEEKFLSFTHRHRTLWQARIDRGAVFPSNV